MRGERADHTLESSALVHETYLRLCELREVKWRGSAHFRIVAAGIMRRVLIDHSRRHATCKRRGRVRRIGFDEARVACPPPLDLLALDGALEALERHDRTLAKIVELRYFLGLDNAEVAEQLGVSVATIKRKWSLARAWLYRAMQGSAEPAVRGDADVVAHAAR